MPELENRPQKRQVAYKIRIIDFLNNPYIKEEGWEPNYIDLNGRKVSRINLIGTIVLKNDNNNVILDDGTGKVSLRVFENNLFFEIIGVGDIILLIGRPREFGSEKYILPEIVKKIDNPSWIKVRTLELGNENTKAKEEKQDIAQEQIEESNDPSEKIFNLIKKLDKGEGVNTEEVLKISNEPETEDNINFLLEKGEIFEIKPGKLKVLE